MSQDIVVIIPHDEEKKVLIQLVKDSAEEGREYDLFSIGLPAGVQPLDKAREFAKELFGIELQSDRYVVEQVYQRGKDNGVRYVFTERVNKSAVPEGSDRMWFTIPEALVLEIPPYAMDILKRLRDVL
ncbi:hypothetical protein GOV11_00270 [Candidatus Woesearchaeota archaeon]|nr:hypothetical protein [Candidatus Woesearchaeota archaeon]